MFQLVGCGEGTSKDHQKLPNHDIVRTGSLCSQLALAGTPSYTDRFYVFSGARSYVRNSLCNQWTRGIITYRQLHLKILKLPRAVCVYNAYSHILLHKCNTMFISSILYALGQVINEQNLRRNLTSSLNYSIFHSTASYIIESTLINMQKIWLHREKGKYMELDGPHLNPSSATQKV